MQMPYRILSDYTSAQLKAFLKNNDWSLTIGSQNLGISRRTLGDYTRGEQVPLDTAITCWLYDRFFEYMDYRLAHGDRGTHHPDGRINYDAFANRFPERAERADDDDVEASDG